MSQLTIAPKNVEPEFWDLQDFLSALWTHKKSIILITLLITGMSLLFSFYRGNRYQACVLLQVHHQDFNSLGYFSHPSDNQVVEPFTIHQALIKSNFVLVPTLQTLYPEIDQKKLTEEITEVRSHLTIIDMSNDTHNKNASILQLTLTGRNPDKLIKRVNKIAEITQQKDTERKSIEAKRTLAFLNQQLPMMQNNLKNAEAKLNHYRSFSGKIDIKAETQHLLAQVSDLDKTLENLHLSKMELSQQFTLQHPLMISLKRKQMALKNKRAALMEQIKKLPAADQVAANLSRDVQVKSNLYMTLLNKINEQEVVTAGIISDISVLAWANSAETIPSPSLAIILIVSSIIGFCLGSLGVLFKVLFSRNIRRVDFDQHLKKAM